MGKSVKINCQCLQVFNCSFLNVGPSSNPQPLLLTLAPLSWVHILLPEATVVFVAECAFWFSNFCLRRKAAGFLFTIPLHSSFQPCKLKKKAKIKSHSNRVLWRWAWGGHAHGVGFANRKFLLFLFPSRRVLLFFSLPATFLEMSLLSYF